MLEGVSAGRDIRIEKIQSIGVVYNIPSATPAFSYRGIAGVPPPTEQSTIQQRMQLVEAIYTKLTQPGMNALALTGIGGVGKSTLAALLFRYAQTPPSTGTRFFQAPPLWLSIDQAATVADVIGTIFQRLDKPLTVLDNLSPTGQVEALFTLLDTLALPRLIVLDQFENLLDWATGRALPTQPGVGELIDALNSRPWKSNARLLLTSRPFPRGTREAPPTCLHDSALDGLTQQEGLALFRSRGIQALEADMHKAVTFCDGHPLSLVLLMALIQLYGLPLADLLAEPTLWIGDIATNLLDAVFRHLREEQQAVLRAFSVYRTAVPVAALRPFLPGSSSQQILLSLRSLLVQQMIQPAGNGCYQVHTVVARYVQTHFVEADQQANQQALRTAHAMAAHYYLEQAQTSALPREQRRRITDIQGFIETIWQYTQAAKWQEAYALIEQENLFSDLSLWGGNIVLLDLCQWFLPQTEWQPEPEQATTIYLVLGDASISLGKQQQALEYYQQALSIFREEGDRYGESTALTNIGLVYDNLGKQQQALEYYQQALSIKREVGAGGGTTLTHIGGIYAAQGKQQQALEYYQQALSISREEGDRQEEGNTLTYIGSVHDDLGDQQQALTYYQQALSIYREVGARASEGTTLNTIGGVYDNLGDQQQALTYYQQALSIYREVGARASEGTTLNTIGNAYAALDKQQQALEYYQQALSIQREEGDRYKESTALTNIGLVYDNLGKQQQALEYYQQALSIKREVGAGGGTTLTHIGGIYAAQGKQQQALEYYQQALSISREEGDRYEESTVLTHIGGVYTALGKQQQALEFYQQALGIHREADDRKKEGITLNTIGNVYHRLGKQQQALEYYQQAWVILREVGDRGDEGVTQWNIGAVAFRLHHYDLAMAAFLLARHCFEEVSSPHQHQVEKWIITLHQKIGQEQFVALRSRVEPQAQQCFEQALHHGHAQHEEEE